jgi:pyruvate formate lyase activating enzyme
MQRGMIFNLQRYSVQDGPGIRTTVFLKGCPLRCAWCHNPEGISPDREMVILENRCVACLECRRVCSFGAAEPEAGVLPVRDERCHFCGQCIDACPTEARQMVGREVTVSEVIAEVRRDRVFYEESGGGITFSGGEPLAQPEFLLRLLRACKEEGFHTAVDTCGQAATRQVLAIAPYTDLFLYDLKMMDEARHRYFTGASNTLILENLRALSGVHGQIWIRVPIIPGVNDALADLEATARFAGAIPGVRRVNLLPYHRIGITKFHRLGLEATLAARPAPSAAALSAARSLFERAGMDARLGG